MPLGFDLLGVVDACLLRTLVDLGLVRQVGVVGAVPVHVVFGDVEADAGDRRDGVAPVQLEAGEFDGEDVVVHRVAEGIQDRGCRRCRPRSPSGPRPEASIRSGPTVVVLPLVPVMVSQSAVLRPSRSRTRQASSTSPQTGMCARAAAASRAWSGRQPGEVTISSGFSPSTLGTESTASSPRSTSAAPTIRSVSAWARALALSAASTTTTRAPSSIRVSAAAKPEMPMPVTTTRSPASPSPSWSGIQPRRAGQGSGIVPLTAGPPIRRRRCPGRRRRRARKGSRTGPRR